eukprot:2578151-Rhodomonas_salina.5
MPGWRRERGREGGGQERWTLELRETRCVDVACAHGGRHHALKRLAAAKPKRQKPNSRNRFSCTSRTGDAVSSIAVSSVCILRGSMWPALKPFSTSRLEFASHFRVTFCRTGQIHATHTMSRTAHPYACLSRYFSTHCQEVTAVPNALERDELSTCRKTQRSAPDVLQRRSRAELSLFLAETVSQICDR